MDFVLLVEDVEEAREDDLVEYGETVRWLYPIVSDPLSALPLTQLELFVDIIIL
jgi:hypothetical protein